MLFYPAILERRRKYHMRKITLACQPPTGADVNEHQSARPGNSWRFEPLKYAWQQ